MTKSLLVSGLLFTMFFVLISAGGESEGQRFDSMANSAKSFWNDFTDYVKKDVVPKVESGYETASKVIVEDVAPAVASGAESTYYFVKDDAVPAIKRSYEAGKVLVGKETESDN